MQPEKREPKPVGGLKYTSQPSPFFARWSNTSVVPFGFRRATSLFAFAFGRSDELPHPLAVTARANEDDRSE